MDSLAARIQRLTLREFGKFYVPKDSLPRARNAGATSALCGHQFGNYVAARVLVTHSQNGLAGHCHSAVSPVPAQPVPSPAAVSDFENLGILHAHTQPFGPTMLKAPGEPGRSCSTASVPEHTRKRKQV
jgi:hypothetical protein